MNRKKLIIVILVVMVAMSTFVIAYSAFEVHSILASTTGVDKKVAVFYYGWYGNTTDYSQASPYPIDDSDDWWHWNYEDRGWYPPANACSTNTPNQGWYDSSDPSLIQTHLEQAEWAGLDAFVISYWGYGGKERKNMQIMMDVAKEINSAVKLAPYFEIFAVAQEGRPHEEIVSRFTSELSQLYDFLMQEDYRDQIWLENGDPVIWVYVVQAVSVDAWVEVMDNLHDENKSFFIVADRPSRKTEQNVLFQAQHQYDVYAPTRDRRYFDTFFSMKKRSKRFNQIFVAGVAPAYNDTVVRDGNAPFGREGGNFYEDRWNDALSLHPDWISITSWNEWHEGTEIEPSKEDGNVALQQTQQFVSEFKSGVYNQLNPSPPSKVLWYVWNEFYYVLIGGWTLLAVMTIVSFYKVPVSSKNL
ncbi:MAG: hypothetical protein ACTSRD_02280 [Promethearchaeota archaeon]